MGHEGTTGDIPGEGTISTTPDAHFAAASKMKGAASTGKHTILVLASSCRAAGQPALVEEVGALHGEMRRSSRRDSFAIETRWASEPLELLRALRELKPTVVHWSGCGDRTGLLFPDLNGVPRVVPSSAIAHAFEAAGSSVKLVVLSADDSSALAEALLPHVACMLVVGAPGHDEMVRAFLIGFYGALGESESVAGAFSHGNAAIALIGSASAEATRPRLLVRSDVCPMSIILFPASEVSKTSSCENLRDLQQVRGEAERTIAQEVRLEQHEAGSEIGVQRSARRTRRRRLWLSVSTLVALLLLSAVWKQQDRVQDQTSVRLPPTQTTRERGAPNAVVKLGLAENVHGDAILAVQTIRPAKDSEFADDYRWVSAYHQGVVAEHSNDLVAAEVSLKSAIDIVESMRARAVLDLRPWVLESRRQPYDALFALLAGQHKDAEALTIAEQMHSRTWMDARVATGDFQIRPMLGVAAAVEPLSSSALLSMLGDREALVYFQTRGDLWRIHLASGKVIELTQLSVGIETLLARWRRSSYDEALFDELGAALLPAELSTSQHPLYIVAPQSLAQFPFAALRHSQRYLIEDRPVVRLSGLAELNCSTRHTTSSRPVVIADSKLDLPQARAEARYVAQTVSGSLFIGGDAKIEKIEQASQAALLHVGVHGNVGRGGGSLTLADGELSAGTIIAHRIAPTIVVLSACSSSNGGDPEGSGALSAAFLAAGTRTVVATLGAVDDREAALLMRAFYAAGGDVHPAAALATAQQEIARSSAMPPDRWGTFAVWGHAEPSECHQE